MHPVITELKKLSHQYTVPAAILLSIRSRIERKRGIANRLGSVFPEGCKGVLLSGKAGVGKAQPLYSKILTPNGWKTMGNIREGDVVCCPDGTTADVLQLFPQGDLDIYRVTFSDGATVDCTDEHLWQVSDISKLGGKANKKTRHERWKKNIYTTSFLREKIISNKRGSSRFSVFTIKPCVFATKKVDIDPYLLGCLIGDGYLCSRTPSITTNDSEIVENLKRRLTDGYQLTCVKNHSVDAWYITRGQYGVGREENHYTTKLKKMGLYGCRSEDKFIPYDYIYNSIEVRLALIQGLMDTDGTINKHEGTASYCTVSERLANDVKTIIQSLGGIVTISKKSSFYYSKSGNKHYGQTAYILYIKYNNTKDLFQLSRKKKLARNRTKYPTKRMIRSIVKIGKYPAQCILIDHPEHLYITDYFIPTHNTRTLRAIYDGLGLDSLNNDGQQIGKWYSSAGATTPIGLLEVLQLYNHSIIFLDELGLDSQSHIGILKQISNGEIVHQKYESTEPIPFNGMVIAASNGIRVPRGNNLEHLLALLDRFIVVKVKAPNISPNEYLNKVLNGEKEETVDWNIIKAALINNNEADLNENEKLLLKHLWEKKSAEILDKTRSQFRNANYARDILLFTKRILNADDISKSKEAIKFAYDLMCDTIIFNPINLLWLTPLEETIYSTIAKKNETSLQEIITACDNAGLVHSIKHVHHTINVLISNMVIYRTKHGCYSTRKLSTPVVQKNTTGDIMSEVL